MLDRRWLGVAVVLVAAGLAALALFDEAPSRPVAPLWSIDAGPLALRAPGVTWSTKGARFPTATLTPSATKACVRGRVIDGVSGAGVAGASVALETFAGVVSTKTDARGGFELFGLSEGVVSVAEVAAAGYQPQRPERGVGRLELRLVEGRCVADLSLTLQPSVELEVHVVGVRGAPIERARVTVASERAASSLERSTDAMGVVRVDAPEGAVIVASAEGWRPTADVVDFRALATRQLVLRLEPEVDGGAPRLVLSGQVVDALDAGVASADVELRRGLVTSSGEHEWLEAVLTTDVSGAFSVETRAFGTWTVTATRGRAHASAVTTGAPVRLALAEGASLRGSVKAPDGRPVVSFGVLVSLHRDALARSARPAHHVVDPEGTFHLVALPPGRADVVVVAPGFAPSDAVVVELSGETERRVDVTLSLGATVSGAVVDRETRRALPNARVSLERALDDTLLPIALTRTDGDGRFRLSGLPVGRRSLLVTASDHDARLVSVELAANETRDLVIDVAAVPDGGTPELELVGIGAVLKAHGAGLVVERVVPSGGAAEAGVVAGDVILKVERTPVVALGFEGAIERIRGAEGSFVALELEGRGNVLVPRRRLIQ